MRALLLAATLGLPVTGATAADRLPVGFFTWFGDTVPESLDASAFPVLVPYGCEGAPSEESVRAYLGRNGRFRIIFTLKDVYKGARWFPGPGICGTSDPDAMAKCLVEKFDSARNVIGWYAVDEPSLTMGRDAPARIRRRAGLIEGVSRKPVFVEDLPESPHWEAIGDPARIHLTSAYSVPEGEPMQAYHATAKIRTRTGGKVWTILQAYAKHAYSPKLDARRYRYPTLAEIRAMSFLALSAGAEGILFFSLRDAMKHPDAGFLPGLDSLSRELQGAYPMVRALASKGAAISGTAVVLTGAHGGRNHLVAVNASPTETATVGHPGKAGVSLRLEPLAVRMSSW